MSDDHRTVTIDRQSLGRYTARNPRGGEISIAAGEGSDFTPVELLLVAIAGCSGADVDYITAKRAEAESFTVTVDADKVRDEQGNRLENITMTFTVAFPEGEAGDAAREVLPAAIQRSHDRLCTVSRTIERGTAITPTVG